MNPTSSDWVMEGKRLIQNRKGIRIAANQNHGIRPLEEEPSSIPPQNHRIQNNEIRDNLIGIELEKAKDTQIARNILDNVVTNVDEK